jgi:hypothetical protein
MVSRAGKCERTSPFIQYDSPLLLNTQEAAAAVSRGALREGEGERGRKKERKTRAAFSAMLLPGDRKSVKTSTQWEDNQVIGGFSSITRRGLALIRALFSSNDWYLAASHALAPEEHDQ